MLNYVLLTEFTSFRKTNFISDSLSSSKLKKYCEIKKEENNSSLEQSFVDDPDGSVTKDDIEAIRDLRIKLSFTPPPLHQMIKRSTKPDKELYEAVRKAQIDIKTGVFSVLEDEIIKKNWESFLKVNFYSALNYFCTYIFYLACLLCYKILGIFTLFPVNVDLNYHLQKTQAVSWEWANYT